MAEIDRNKLTFPQQLTLANWLTAENEAKHLDYKKLHEVAPMAEAALGFRITTTNVRNMRNQLNIKWPNFAPKPRAPKYAKLTRDDALCIVNILCEVTSRMPSMKIDPEHCLESLRDRLLDTMTESNE